jgi:hypothetical protein
MFHAPVRQRAGWSIRLKPSTEKPRERGSEIASRPAVPAVNGGATRCAKIPVNGGAKTRKGLKPLARLKRQ